MSDRLVIYPDKRLTTATAPVSEFGGMGMFSIVSDLGKACVLLHGQGMAANQIGYDKSILVYINADEGKMHHMVNPEIVSQSQEESFIEEGCLSIPGINIVVPRAVGITVKYSTAAGEERTESFRGPTARTVQHEVDHLRGTLILDYLIKRGLAFRMVMDRYHKDQKKMARRLRKAA